MPVAKKTTKVKNNKNNKNNKWYKKVRGSYLPASWQGWLTYIPYVGLLILIMEIAKLSFDTIGGIVLGVFPAWVATAVAMQWFASQKS